MQYQGLFYVPEIIKIKLTSHFGIEKTRGLVTRMVQQFDGRFIDGFHDGSPLEKHQLRFNPCHRWLTQAAGAN